MTKQEAGSKIVVDTIIFGGKYYWSRQDIMLFLWRASISKMSVSDVARMLEEMSSG